MANINISIDTDNKAISVTVDGKKLESVSDVHAYSDDVYGYFGLDICMYEKDGDLRKYTRLCANDSAKAAVEKGGKELENGLVQVADKNPLVKALASALKRS